MRLSRDTFFKHKHAPYYQVAFVVTCIVVANMCLLAIGSTGWVTWEPLSCWVISGSMLLAYATINTLIGLISEQKMNIYYGKSITGFLALAMIASFLAKSFSGLSMSEAGSMRWIYIVITIGFLIFMGIMMLMRTVVAFAQREDENLRQNK